MGLGYYRVSIEFPQHCFVYEVHASGYLESITATINRAFEVYPNYSEEMIKSVRSRWVRDYNPIFDEL